MSLPHHKMVATIKENGICMNCLRPGHFIKQCKSQHRCKHCQRPHHTLLHVEANGGNPDTPVPASPPANQLLNHAATTLKSNALLMTCLIRVSSATGPSSLEARAILDSASSVSFISEHLAQSLHLPRSHQVAQISGVAGLSHKSPSQSVANFVVSSVQPSGAKFDVTGVVVPRVTCDLPLQAIPVNLKWEHLSDIQLADPTFGQPGRVDVLLGVDIFAQVMLQGRRLGPTGSPVAFETHFGWVLAGQLDSSIPVQKVATYHTSLLTGDDILRKFWEVEEGTSGKASLSPEEKLVVQQFVDNHYRTKEGRFVVPLPKKSNAKPLGESRAQAVRRFLSLERSLRSRGQLDEFQTVIEEYFSMGHAESIPVADLQKPPKSVFYLPMHAVRKDSSTTTKVRAVFDASAKSSNGVSLNDTLCVGPTVHSSLIDVLLRFRSSRVALTTDVSRMYRAVELAAADRDLHRFVWRSCREEPLRDYRMTRVTFGVCASSFAANMAVKQNATDYAAEFPLAAKAVNESFYVDDGLVGADSVQEAKRLQGELQQLFSRGGFVLRKWNSSEPAVLTDIPPDLCDSRSVQEISDSDGFTKTLGLGWNASSDQFRLTISQLPDLDVVTKRTLVSDIAKTFDVLGWFSPAVITVKILLQRLWELKVDWDDDVPLSVRTVWERWRSELSLLSEKCIPRSYFPKEACISSLQLHGFCDASEAAYAGVVCIRMVDSTGRCHISLVASKTKVAPIKRLTIFPRLELCGSLLLAELLFHIREVLDVPTQDLYAWTDSTIVLGWLAGNPRRFKTYVGNRVSHIIELIPPHHWNHVGGLENPADCASQGLLPSELISHQLWWSGPEWLRMDPSQWPVQADCTEPEASENERELCFHITVQPRLSILDRYSKLSQLLRVTTWVLRFVSNCRSRARHPDIPLQMRPSLTTQELSIAETHWITASQADCFAEEIQTLKKDRELPNSSCLLPLRPFLDESSVLRVGGREQNSDLPYASQHPIILSGKHAFTSLVIRSEHVRLLHAGPTLLTASIGRRFHILGSRRAVRSITRGCVTCRRNSVKPQAQLMGQLPVERVTPGCIFEKVGVDYAGPIYIKLGKVRKPTLVKAYICLFVSLSVKAVHLELVSDLTTDAFVASLRRFVARRGKPSLIWSDHGTNFVGADRELKSLFDFLKHHESQRTISNFCSSQKITWKFIPEHAPHFGGLWEAAVKRVKAHLKRVLSNARLTFEEFSTVLCQVEACLNSRPLVPLPCDDDGVEALTPGHFLVGRPLESLPDPPSVYHEDITPLRRWHLCQTLVKHFWRRWSDDYLTSLQRFNKWQHPTRNAHVGDIVILREDSLVPAKWPLARVTHVHPGRDGLVRVVTIKTPTGSYKRPVTKIALLLPTED